MGLFWRVLLAHFVADFTLQTNQIANWKRSSRWGMALHVLTHPLAYIVFAWPYLSWPWVQTRWFHWDGWLCVALLTLFHWLEDEWRIWSIQKTGSPDSTAFFLLDQAAHLIMIFALVPLRSDIPTETWVPVLLCAVLLAHFTSVLIYFMENDLWGVSDVLERRKYAYMGERFLGGALFLLPGYWFLLAFGWIGWVVYLYYHPSKKRTWVHLVIGNGSVIFLGLITRGLLS